MTQPQQVEAHLLVVLGEVRGDVKGILRTQQDFSARLTEIEKRLGQRVDTVEDRITDLERYRWKVGGFTIAVGILSSLVFQGLQTLGLTQ